MGINRAVDNFKAYEKWARMVEQRAAGRVKIEVTSLPELGMGGGNHPAAEDGRGGHCRSVRRLCGRRAALIEIVELPGVFLDAETAKKAHQAWKPHLPNCWTKSQCRPARPCHVPGAGLFSKKPIRKLQDFKDLVRRVCTA